MNTEKCRQTLARNLADRTSTAPDAPALAPAPGDRDIFPTFQFKHIRGQYPSTPSWSRSCQPTNQLLFSMNVFSLKNAKTQLPSLDLVVAAEQREQDYYFSRTHPPRRVVVVHDNIKDNTSPFSFAPHSHQLQRFINLTTIAPPSPDHTDTMKPHQHDDPTAQPPINFNIAAT